MLISVSLQAGAFRLSEGIKLQGAGESGKGGWEKGGRE